jgi:hypothetical protein
MLLIAAIHTKPALRIGKFLLLHIFEEGIRFDGKTPLGDGLNDNESSLVFRSRLSLGGERYQAGVPQRRELSVTLGSET